MMACEGDAVPPAADGGDAEAYVRSDERVHDAVVPVHSSGAVRLQISHRHGGDAPF